MPPEPLILSFDTSAARCAAALLSGDRLLAERSEDMERGQAERLMPLLEELLAEAGAGWRDLAAIGVGIGPGNFTGIRIAVAAARGLALALAVPAIGVNGFEALALGQDGPVLCSLDGRRGRCWIAPPDQLDLAELTTPEELAGALPVAFLERDVIGHRAEEIAALTGGRALPPAAPLAEAIARIAAARRATPQQRPAPLYLRSADAAPPSDPPPAILP
ncbi:tRNA (adenosine(37)-N6)-threonylcarbamoyltransferase complex dimerization subunit type 1 TsaB [Acidimangrovimonas pyrenivorans]|uniref:tRNA (Adenosine(37)-N6)-threonylcarbamoyltransferase complex dimerization subunit type 1 TsaB n=1 Tax=Acidimangrovimonas pyrenivorans TaxID=2030798 RepID=A0ABV7AIU1_9RHOB